MKEKLTKFFAAHIRWLRFAIPVFIMGAIYVAVHQELGRINLGKAVFLIRHANKQLLAVIVVGSFLGIFVMSLYDVLALKYCNVKMRALSLVRVAWIANTSNNFLGFGGVAGSAVRVYLYGRYGAQTGKSVRVSLLIAAVSLTGCSVYSMLALCGIFGRSVYVGHPTVYLILGAMAVYLLLYYGAILFKPLHRLLGDFQSESLRASFAMTVVSCIEWFAAGVVFWVACKLFMPTIPLHIGMAVFIAAIAAGMLVWFRWNGSFDMMAIYLLTANGFNINIAVSAILVFRVFFFIIPWIAGLVLAVPLLTKSTVNAQALEQEPFDGRFWDVWRAFVDLPSKIKILPDLGVMSLSVLVFLSGMILLLSAATPGLLERVHFMDTLLTRNSMVFAAQLSVMVGIFLLVLSRQIRFRVRRAWIATLVILPAGALFTFAKGFDFEEALFLVVVLVLLWISRSSFYREYYPLGLASIVFWLVLTIGIAAGYWLLGRESADVIAQMQKMGIKGNLYLVMSFNDFGGVSFGLLLSWMLIAWMGFDYSGRFAPKKAYVVEQLGAFAQQHEHRPMLQLGFLGDKKVFQSEKKDSLLLYAKAGRYLVALGMPHGVEECMDATLDNFLGYADRLGLKTMIYGVSSDSLGTLNEHGYRFFKLGEEAIVDLSEFTMEGKKKQSLRTARNHLQRDGYMVQFIEPPLSDVLIAELRTVSDEWLVERGELGFSMGWFEAEFIRKLPVLVIRDNTNEVKAFASILTGSGGSACVDMMRRRNNIENWVMNGLFTELIFALKERGFLYLSLGAAPLAGVGEGQYSSKVERGARFLFRHGDFFYGFSGLRAFKEKFSPRWEPVFLAYPNGSKLTEAIFELRMLILISPRRAMKIMKKGESAVD